MLTTTVLGAEIFTSRIANRPLKRVRKKLQSFLPGTKSTTLMSFTVIILMSATCKLQLARTTIRCMKTEKLDTSRRLLQEKRVKKKIWLNRNLKTTKKRVKRMIWLNRIVTTTKKRVKRKICQSKPAQSRPVQSRPATNRPATSRPA